MLEIIAMITMLIDHVGILFFEDQPIFRIVGRIAFPIYVYGVYVGYQHTSNIKKYYFRLLGLALLAQIPYSLAFYTFRPNVIFSLLLALLVLTLLDKINYYLTVPIIIVIGIMAEYYHLEYGAYGIIMVILYKYVPKNWLLLPFLALNLFWFYVLDKSYLQLYSMLSVIFIIFHAWLPKVKIDRTFYRMFYPVHLLILWIINLYTRL
jgi:hypothetical protein